MSLPFISMTDIVSFLTKTGTSKVTKVEQILRRPRYQPAFDYWKPVRDAIILGHRTGQICRDFLVSRVSRTFEGAKRVNYFKAVSAYMTFLGRKISQWSAPAQGLWKCEGLSVRVNPELGLLIDGDLYTIKLIFSKEGLSRQEAEMLLALLNDGLSSGVADGTNYCLLNVLKGRLYLPRVVTRKVRASLRAEALTFVGIWQDLTRPASA